jgi:hypothetical protein
VSRQVKGQGVKGYCFCKEYRIGAIVDAAEIKGIEGGKPVVKDKELTSNKVFLYGFALPYLLKISLHQCIRNNHCLIKHKYFFFFMVLARENLPKI